MALIALGLRLAVAGGRTGRRRAVLAVAGAAIGVAVLLLAVAVARLVPATVGPCGGLLSCSQRTQAAVLVFLGAPVLVLLATVARLSAATRDRRLAALRLLGTSARATRLVSAVETGVLALAGTAVGVPTFLLVRRLLGGIDLAGLPHFGDRLDPSLPGALAVIGTVPLLAVVVSLAPTRQITRAPLSLRRGGPAKRPRMWRLAPFGVGLALLAYAATRPPPADTSGSPIPWLAGSALAALGLPLAVPVAVRLGADLLARHASGVAVRLGARRLQLEPAASTRVVAALLTGLLLAVGAQGVLVAFERTTQYIDALRSETTGPQYLHVAGAQSIPRSILLGVAGIRAAIPLRQAGSPRDPSVEVFIGSCPDLRALMPSVRRCDDAGTAWLGSARQHTAGPLYLSGGNDWKVSFSVPAPAKTWPVDNPRQSSGDQTYSFSLFVPLSTPGLPPAATEVAAWQVIADGGAGPRLRLAAALHPADPTVMVETNADLINLDLVRRLHAILWAATALVLLVGFLALAIAAVDRAAERRRNIVGLNVVGVPARIIRRSHLLQALLPIAVGVPVAGAAGLLAARGYLAFAGEAAYTPWASSIAVTAAALLIGVVLGLATLPLVSRRVSAEHLRRE